MDWVLTLLQYWIWLIVVIYNTFNSRINRWCYIWDFWENYKNKPWRKNKASVFCFIIHGSNINASALCETFYIGSSNYRIFTYKTSLPLKAMWYVIIHAVPCMWNYLKASALCTGALRCDTLTCMLLSFSLIKSLQREVCNGIDRLFGWQGRTKSNQAVLFSDSDI